jgi:hypothetical protein
MVWIMCCRLAQSQLGQVQVVHNDRGDGGEEADHAEEGLDVGHREPLEQPVLQVDDNVTAVGLVHAGQTPSSKGTVIMYFSSRWINKGIWVI